MNRRTFIGTGAVAGVGIATMGLKCGGPSVNGTVTIIMGAISELRVLFPTVPALDKVISLAKSFNEAWVAGKFDDARSFFENLDTTVGQVIADLGINASTRIKLLLASVGIAVRTIAALIKEQGDANLAVAGAVRQSAPRTVSRIEKLADAAAADQLLKAVMVP